MAEINKLDAILEAVTDIRVKFEKRDSEVALQIGELQKVAKENKECIKGNGKPGLETQVALLQENMRRVNWIGGLLFVAILTDVLSRILK